MAVLQNIRNNAGVLVSAIIGLSLFIFVFTDFFQSGSTLFRSRKTEIGTIDRESVQYQDFQKKVEQLGEIYKSNTGKTQLTDEEWTQVREQTWQDLLKEKVMGKSYDKIGLGVTSDELYEMVQGNNPHPIIQQIFTNPETGVFDRSGVVNFLKNLETGVTSQQRSYWLYLEKQIVSERAMAKYNNLINKGLYVAAPEAQQSLELKNKQVNIEYIGLNPSIIADSLVKVSKDQIAEYYELHKNDYKEAKTRTIEYITWKVTPSSTDFANAQKWINDIYSDFKNTNDNVQFVTSNSDVSFNGTWYSMTSLPDSLSAWIKGGALVNGMYGPYFENNSYKIAKVHKIEMMPDSVQARHILLKVNTAEEVTKVKNLADSLKKVIENGGDFAALARQYSTDTGSAVKGGDLGWFKRGQMVKSFEDSAFINKVNEIRIAPSQYGIHIIQTTKQGVLNKQVQIAILERIVTPSTQTYQATYAQASKFASQNTTKAKFDEAAGKEKLTKRSAVLREEDRTLADLEYPRTIIRSAFEADKGSILKNTDGSPIFELGDNFIIATLVQATDEGISPLESVKSRVELQVLRENKNKLLAERLKKAAEGKTDMYSIASEVGGKVSIGTDISFATNTLPDVGFEPAVIGTAVALQPNVISSPFVGNNGVYLVKVTSEQPIADSNVEAEKTRQLQALGNRAASQSFDIHQKAVKVVDKRVKFY